MSFILFALENAVSTCKIAYTLPLTISSYIVQVNTQVQYKYKAKSIIPVKQKNIKLISLENTAFWKTGKTLRRSFNIIIKLTKLIALQCGSTAFSTHDFFEFFRFIIISNSNHHKLYTHIPVISDEEGNCINLQTSPGQLYYFEAY